MVVEEPERAFPAVLQHTISRGLQTISKVEQAWPASRVELTCLARLRSDTLGDGRRIVVKVRSLYLSCDMEGTAGVATWNQVLPGHADYPRAQRLMTAEVAAACRAALDAGVEHVLVNDAHATMDNLLHEELPDGVTCLQGSPKPGGMMAGLESEGPFDAVAFLGYHAPSGTPRGNMAHAVTRRVHDMDVNGIEVGEAWMNAAYASSLGVPVVLISGDRIACEGLAEQVDGIRTVVVKWGVAEEAAVSLHPQTARSRIHEAVRNLLNGAAELAAPMALPPGPFRLTLRFARQVHADHAVEIPGASRDGAYTVRHEHADFLETYRAYHAMTKLATLATP